MVSYLIFRSACQRNRVPGCQDGPGKAASKLDAPAHQGAARQVRGGVRAES